MMNNNKALVSFSFNRELTKRSKESNVSVPTKVILSLESAEQYLPDADEFKHGVPFYVKYNSREIEVVVNFYLKSFDFIVI